jgi:hypothetical protein
MDCGRSVFDKRIMLQAPYGYKGLIFDAYLFNSCSNLFIRLSFQVMSNQEAVDCIKDIKDARSSAKRLTEEAVNRKSNDDISCIVVKLQ